MERGTGGGRRLSMQAMRAHPFVLLVLLCPAASLAFPIAPQTLWDLARDAELVVFAKVEGVAPQAEGGHQPWASDVATLQATTTLKGPRQERLSVEFSARRSCPAPAVYRVGSEVLAFLERSPDGRAWHTTGLSYGTRYAADAQEREALLGVVRLALSLQASALATDAQAPVEWAIRAAAAPVTRWDGLYAFDRRSDPDYAAYDLAAKGTRRPDGGDFSRALARAFIDAPSYDRSLPVALRALRGDPSTAVTQAAVDAFEAVLRDNAAPYWSGETLELISARLGDAPPAARGEASAGPVDVELTSARLGDTPPPVRGEVSVAPVNVELISARLGDAPPPAREEPSADPIDEELLRLRKVQVGPSVEADTVAQQRWDTLKRAHRLSPRPRAGHTRRANMRTGGDSPL